LFTLFMVVMSNIVELVPFEYGRFVTSLSNNIEAINPIETTTTKITKLYRSINFTAVLSGLSIEYFVIVLFCVDLNYYWLYRHRIVLSRNAVHTNTGKFHFWSIGLYRLDKFKKL